MVSVLGSIRHVTIHLIHDSVHFMQLGSFYSPTLFLKKKKLINESNFITKNTTFIFLYNTFVSFS